MKYREEAQTHLTFLWGIYAALKSEDLAQKIFAIERILEIADSDVNYWKQKAIELGYKEGRIE